MPDRARGFRPQRDTASNTGMPGVAPDCRKVGGRHPKLVIFPGRCRLPRVFTFGVGALLAVLLFLLISSWVHRRNDVAPHAPLQQSPAAQP